MSREWWEKQHETVVEHRYWEPRMPKEVKFGWETIHTAIDSLAYLLEPSKPLGIVGVARGGLIPATMLSHRMKLPLKSVSAASYDESRKQSHEVIIRIDEHTKNEILANPSRWVIVDDVLDTGKTYDMLRDCFPQCMYVVVVTKRPLLRTPAFAHVPHDVWVKFPWE